MPMMGKFVSFSNTCFTSIRHNFAAMFACMNEAIDFAFFAPNFELTTHLVGKPL